MTKPRDPDRLSVAVGDVDVYGVDVADWLASDPIPEKEPVQIEPKYHPTTDGLGWVVLRSWGNWYLSWTVDEDKPKLNHGSLVLSFNHSNGYWIGLDRIDENDWYDHVARKSWITTKDASDLADALKFCRSLAFDKKVTRKKNK